MLCGRDLEKTSEFFTQRLGFRVDTVFPADDPEVVVISGHGLRIRLVRGNDASPGFLRLICDDPAGIAGGATELTAPNGTRIELVPADPPLTMQPGDCVLQPPQIRHRVIECSPGLEVIEIGCPAAHETCADHELPLPTGELRPDRAFNGQRFVHHVASAAEWMPWRFDGFECRDIGIGVATEGLAGVRVARPVGSPSPQSKTHDGEFLFLFVLRGSVSLHCEGVEQLAAGDCFVVPAGAEHAFAGCSEDLELLEVALPATSEGTGGPS